MASPTAVPESALSTAVQETEEKCHVIALDAPNAFMQTFLEDVDKKVIVTLRGKMAETM